MAGTLELAFYLKAIDEFTRPLRQVSRNVQNFTREVLNLPGGAEIEAPPLL